MRMKELPDEIESTCLGSGCPNGCWYCHEPKEVIYKGVPEFKKEKVYLYDMNILAYPDPYRIIDTLGKSKRYFELSSGIDFRRLDLPMACLLRKYRFGRFNKTTGKWSRYIRFAWDFGQELQYKMLDTFDLFLDAGFKPNQIGVFMLVNGKDVDPEHFLRKLDTLKFWGCQVDDCCFDGGYPKDEEDYLRNYTHYWSYNDIVRIRAISRKHDQKVTRKGMDPEIKVKHKDQTELHDLNHG